jgi:cytoskeletal protein CcmA (bactofilin family)
MGPTNEEGSLNALLGRESEFEGKLSFEGTVRIDGRFSGEIFTDGTLIVGESAQIEAEIEVGTIVVRGEIHGNVTASEAVELRAPSRVYGNVKTPSLMIEKGVLFEGGCQMAQARVEK